MARYRSLIIAPRISPPDTPLPEADKEVSAIVSNLGGDQELLQGNVTVDAIMVALEKQIDIIWFVTHSDERGILLSNGKFLTPSRLIQVARGAGVELIVLNTCSSVGAAFKIHNELRTFLICTLGDTPDDTAYATGRRLARALGKGMTFLAAFNEAIPGTNDNWLFFPGQEEEVRMPPPARSRPGVTAYDGNADESLEQIKALVAEMEKVVHGDERLGIPGLAPTMKNILERLSKLEAMVRSVRVFMWVIFATVILLAAVTILWYSTLPRVGAIS